MHDEARIDSASWFSIAHAARSASPWREPRRRSAASGQPPALRWSPVRTRGPGDSPRRPARPVPQPSRPDVQGVSAPRNCPDAEYARPPPARIRQRQWYRGWSGSVPWRKNVPPSSRFRATEPCVGANKKGHSRRSGPKSREETPKKGCERATPSPSRAAQSAPLDGKFKGIQDSRAVLCVPAHASPQACVENVADRPARSKPALCPRNPIDHCASR